jgi:hypothetical protein
MQQGAMQRQKIDFMTLSPAFAAGLKFEDGHFNRSSHGDCYAALRPIR